MTPIGTQCSSCFLSSELVESSKTNEPLWLLGTNFLRGYYAEFDQTAATVRIGVHANHPTKAAPVEATRPPRKQGGPETMAVWTFWGAMLGMIPVSVFFYFRMLD